MNVAATYYDAAVQQLPCSWVKNLENTHSSCVTYEYLSIIKWIDPKQWQNAQKC